MKKYRCPFCPAPRPPRLTGVLFANHLAGAHGFCVGNKIGYYCRLCDDGDRSQWLSYQGLLRHFENHGGLATHILETKLGDDS
jgi:hypothetical protein